MLKAEITLPYKDISLLRDFAEKHGGQITNESITLDEPSTFSLEIDADTIDMKYPHFQQE